MDGAALRQHFESISVDVACRPGLVWHQRQFIFSWTPDCVPHYLPVNLQHIVQNAILIFHISEHKPNDLDPVYIINTVNILWVNGLSYILQCVVYLRVPLEFNQ